MPTPRLALSLAVLTVLTGAFPAASPRAQPPSGQQPDQGPWTEEDLLARSRGFLVPGLLAELQQIAALIARGEALQAPLAAAIQGDHREYALKVAGYLDQLADPRWQAREAAERALIEMGARSIAQIDQRATDGRTLEERIRARRIVDAIEMRGTSEERDRVRILRGLAATAMYAPASDALREALRSALGHSEPAVVRAALLALGRHADDDAAALLLRRLRAASGDGVAPQRDATLAGLGLADVEVARAGAVEMLIEPGVLGTEAAVALLADLRDGGRLVAAERTRLATEAADPAVRALAAVELPAAGFEAQAATLDLADRTEVSGRVLGLTGHFVRAADVVDGLPQVWLDRERCHRVRFESEAQPPAAGADTRLFLKQGTHLVGTLVAVDDTRVTLRSALFGDVQLPRTEIQGIALDPALDRLIGASDQHDRLRLRDGALLDGLLVGVDAETVRYRPLGTAPDAVPEQLPRSQVAGLLLQRPRRVGGAAEDRTYTRVELSDGSRLLADLGGAAGGQIALHVGGVGAVAAPVEQIAGLEFGVGGGAMWGFTVIADYSDNRIFEVDDQGKVVFSHESIYGPFDVECLDNGNLLVTEFALSRIVEMTREGEEVWVLEGVGEGGKDQLRNPYDADMLPNGNILIADTFGGRVLEVNRAGEVLWSFTGVDPYDVERLPNGNTLIADEGDSDRAIEVTPAGDIVWEVSKLPGIHDVDRLSNGNTLITLRGDHRVIEVDRDGKKVFEIRDLQSPTDADRLPNGNTLVAENGSVREFDRNGVLVWELEVAWAVEVNRY